jgi:magnesium chelatase family protein
MLAKAYSSAILGVDAYIVAVEVDISFGLPGISVVGLPDTAVQESKERVRSALKNSGFIFPPQRITINMAPANTRKSGPVFDLAIALAILAASEQLTVADLEHSLFVGELSLDGSIRAVSGVLPFAIAAQAAGYQRIFVPCDNAQEASLVEGLAVYPVAHLREAVQLLADRCPSRQAYQRQALVTLPTLPGLDFSEVKGQAYAKRGLEITAAGGHNLIMVGPPGSGKTMLARRLPTILPPLTFAEALEASKIYSISGRLGLAQGLLPTRPFRAPHHSISNAGLVGGSSHPKPGEVSLAHHGVLFLDELLEFRREVLEVLRQPLEDGVVTLSRAQISLTYPAKFMLIASMNPCPCGYRGDRLKACVCTPHQIARYWGKLSGPLLDRIDIHLEVPRLEDNVLLDPGPSEASTQIRARVEQARTLQVQRFADQGILCNAHMQPRHLRRFCALDTRSQQLLQQALQRLHLSARAYDRILKVARTIADLEASPLIQAHHVAEAIQLRILDRSGANSLSGVR